MAYSQATLDRSFGALSHPARRRLVEVLALGPASVGDASRSLGLSKAAVTKHVRVLEQAGLVSRTRRATARLSRLEAEPLREVTTWLARYQRFWDESHERLDDLLAALQAGHDDNPGHGQAAAVQPSGAPPASPTAKGNDDE